MTNMGCPHLLSDHGSTKTSNSANASRRPTLALWLHGRHSGNIVPETRYLTLDLQVTAIAVLSLTVWILVDVSKEIGELRRAFRREYEANVALTALINNVNESLSYLVQNDSNFELLIFQEYVELTLVGIPDTESCGNYHNNSCTIGYFHEYFEEEGFCTFEQKPDGADCWDHCLRDHLGSCENGVCTGECRGKHASRFVQSNVYHRLVLVQLVRL